ncbi:MAG: hypothetical protein R3F56_13155 [Planctomycetota bacterium]
MAELPHLVQVAREFAADGGKVLGVSLDYMVPGATKDGALAVVAKATAKRGASFPNYVLMADSLEAFNALYDLPGPIPCTIALDSRGNEVDRCEEGADLDRLRQMMRRALGK